MALITINDGDEAKAGVLRDNFTYLDNKINNSTVGVDAKISNVESNINNVQKNTQGLISALQNSVAELETKIAALQNTTQSTLQNLKIKPNWNAGHILANNVTYTVGYGDLAYASDGFVFFRCQYSQGTPFYEWKINGNVVGGAKGSYMKWIDSNSILCRVSKGDTIYCNGELIQFFPAI